MMDVTQKQRRVCMESLVNKYVTRTREMRIFKSYTTLATYKCYILTQTPLEMDI